MQREISVTYSKSPLLKITVILLFVISVTLRAIAIPHSNHDMTAYNLIWYQALYQKEIGATLATAFSNYTPPYTYFLALATLTHDFIPPLTAIKLIPICFDLLGAFYVYKIVLLKYHQGVTPYLAAAIYFTAPTIILNSSYWGQVDSLYTTLLLACLYFLLTEKSSGSMLAFGLALSIKAQAVFFLPFLCVMAIQKRVSWLHFGMIPLVYFATILPVVLLGRPFLDALLIYVKQSETFMVLSMNAPNLYSLFPHEWYSSILPVGIMITITVLAYWVYTTVQNKMYIDKKYIVLIAFISTVLVPYLLPKMHDRYFYPADVLSIVLAFYMPALWFMPVLYQLISISAISNFLFGTSSSWVMVGFALNTIALAVLLRTQRLAETRNAADHKISSALSWLVTILTPVILFGVSLNFLLTPAHIRIEYAMPHMPADPYGFSKSERFQWAAQTIDYLTNAKQTRYLSRLKFENGTSVFNEHEITWMDHAKSSLRINLALWRLSLAAVFMLGMFAWAGNWLAAFGHGLKRGGWFTIGAALIPGMALMRLNSIDPDAYFQNAPTLLRLFPISIWQDSFLFMVIILIGSGFLLAISLARTKNAPPD
jgi:Gpi18-like mannosyltransferase